jgi:hypothetical protein
VHHFDTSENDARTSELLEAEHWPCSSLDGSMILLDDVVEILALSDHNVRAVLPVVILDASFVRAALVDVGNTRKEIVLDRARKEPTCGATIAFGSKQEIYGVSLLIYRTIQIAILTVKLDVCFVHAPTSSDRAEAAFTFSPSERFLWFCRNKER